MFNIYRDFFNSPVDPLREAKNCWDRNKQGWLKMYSEIGGFIVIANNCRGNQSMYFRTKEEVLYFCPHIDEPKAKKSFLFIDIKKQLEDIKKPLEAERDKPSLMERIFA